jgi:hypothetical protein
MYRKNATSIVGSETSRDRLTASFVSPPYDGRDQKFTPAIPVGRGDNADTDRAIAATTACTGVRRPRAWIAPTRLAPNK